MGHKDTSRSSLPHTLPGAHHWGTGALGDASATVAGEGEALTLPGIDHADPINGPWWSAWIDLGGEG